MRLADAETLMVILAGKKRLNRVAQQLDIEPTAAFALVGGLLTGLATRSPSVKETLAFIDSIVENWRLETQSPEFESLEQLEAMAPNEVQWVDSPDRPKFSSAKAFAVLKFAGYISSTRDDVVRFDPLPN